MKQTRLGKVGGFLRRTKFIPVVLLLAVLVGGSALYFIQVRPAHADGFTRNTTLHYPWPSAPCEFDTAGGPSCANPKNAADRYDWFNGNNGVFTGNGCGSTDIKKPPSSFCFDQWGYEYRNCTSYVAWKLSQLGVNPKYFTGLGNGGQWYSRAKAAGLVRVGDWNNGKGDKPEVGAAAVWPADEDPLGFGHVAFISNVTYNTDGSVKTITVNEFNQDTQGHGDVWTGPPGAYDKYKNPAGRGFTKWVYFRPFETKVPTPPTTQSITVKGTVSCASHVLYGVWVQSSGGGSGFAKWSWTTSNHYKGTFTRTLSTKLSTKLQLHVGCGGSTSRWWSDNWTLSVSDMASVTLNASCKETQGTTSNHSCNAPTLIMSL